MAYLFKTQGREYSLTLESDGLLHCKDLGISAEKLADLQALVTEHVKTERKAPRIPVLILDNRYNYVVGYTEGSASSKQDRHGYRWVSYKNGDGKTKRATFDSSRLYLDTPENRALADRLVLIGNSIQARISESRTVQGQMVNVTYKGDDE
jgi:hypothetical protein